MVCSPPSSTPPLLPSRTNDPIYSVVVSAFCAALLFFFPPALKLATASKQYGTKIRLKSCRRSPMGCHTHLPLLTKRSRRQTPPQDLCLNTDVTTTSGTPPFERQLITTFQCVSAAITRHQSMFNRYSKVGRIHTTFASKTGTALALQQDLYPAVSAPRVRET